MPRSASRLRVAPALLAAGILSTAVLGVTTSGTLSGFIGTLNNSSGTAATGSLVLQEQDAARSATCTSADSSVASNTASCSFNLLGGSTTLVPGSKPEQTFYLKNVGSVPASTFTLRPTPGAGGCTTGTNGTRNGGADLCRQLMVRVYKGTSSATGVQLFSGQANTLGGATASSFTGFPATLNPGEEIPFTFQVDVPTGTDNSYQGMSVSLPLTWTITS